MEEKTKTEEDGPSYFRAYLYAIFGSLLYVSTGAVGGWSSPVLPKLNLTTEEQSLVGSLYSLGAAPGPFIITFGLDTIGRKGTLYVIWAFFLTSWIILAVSRNLYIIYIARLIGGIALGGSTIAISVYVAEIAVPEIRGRLGSLCQVCMGLGLLIMYAVGPYLNYTPLNWGCAGFTASFGVFLYFIPESPYYYYKKEKRKEAEDALQKLRAYKTREKLEEELSQIEKAILLKKENTISFMENIKQPYILKALGLSIFIASMQQFQGVNPLIAYNQLIFEQAQLTFPASIVPVIYFFAGTVFLILPVLLVNTLLGVKTAYIVSGYGVSFSLGLLGLYFYLINSGGVDMKGYSVISVVFLIMMSLFSHLGVAPLSWPLVAEFLPLSVKGIGSGICGCIGSLVGFVILKFFLNIGEIYGFSTDFFGIAVIMFFSTTLTLFILPDTTGKTLKEIQEIFEES